MAAPGPPEDDPMAMQLRTLEHEMALKLVTVAGMDSVDHELPPSIVTRMLGDPVLASKSLTAWQVVALTQETADRAPTPAGSAWLAHETPASELPMITGLEKMPKPTAVHCDGDTHETPVRPLTLLGIG